MHRFLNGGAFEMVSFPIFTGLEGVESVHSVNALAISGFLPMQNRSVTFRHAEAIEAKLTQDNPPSPTTTHHPSKFLEIPRLSQGELKGAAVNQLIHDASRQCLLHKCTAGNE